jgi:integrase
MKLTQTTVISLSLAAGQRERFEWDDDLKGFGVRIRPTKRTWVIQYRIGTKQRRLTLADVDKLDATKARKAAKDRLAAVQLGGDPQADKINARARAAITLGAKIDAYLLARKPDVRPGTYRGIKTTLKAHWKPLHHMELHRITRADVAARLTELRAQKGPISTLSSRSRLSSFFGWAIREGLCDENPVVGTNKPDKGKARTRVMTPEELRAIWTALSDDDYGRIIKLAMITGGRRHEVAGMTWSEIDMPKGAWTLPLPRLKQWRAFEQLRLEDHKIPLSEFALEIIRTVPRRSGRDLLFGAKEGRPFIGFHVCKHRLDAKIAEMTGARLAPWQLRDLRRTIDTVMQENLAVLPHIADQILGHIGPHKSGVQGVYNRATYWPQSVEAMALWGEHLRAIVEGRTPKVIPLRAQRA